MIGALLALAIPAAAGVALVRWADGRRTLDAPTISLRVGVGLPLGAGLAGLLAWLWLVAGGTLGRGYAAGESIALLAVAAAAWRRTRQAAPAAGPPGAPGAPRVDRLAVAAAALAVALLAAIFAWHARAVPNGDWDAWAVWNLHARFLARAGVGWRLVFSKELAFSHNEYPLLLPSIVARTWAFGGEGTAGPVVVAGLFTLAAPVAVFGAVARRAGSLAAAVAVLLLASTAEWLTWGLSQDADVPLAALVAAAAAALAVAGDAERNERWLAVCAALLGLAAWTKDEGLVYLAVIGGWALLRGGRAGAARRAAALAAGLALPLLVRIHFHAALSPGFAADYTAGQTLAGSLLRAVDPERWALILSQVPPHLPGLGRGLPLAALALPWLLGATPRAALRSPVLLPALCGYAAYLGAYALSAAGQTAERLTWHIATSAPRVLLHPWPALLLALFATVPWSPPLPSGSSRPAGPR